MGKGANKFVLVSLKGPMKKNFACDFSLLPRRSMDDMSLLSLAKM